MRTHPKSSFILILTTILVLVTACGPSGTPDAVATFNPMVTAAAQTMEALLTQAANQQGAGATATQGGGITLPTSTSAPINTLAPTQTTFVIPTMTPFPTAIPATPTPITRCDWVSFVADVNVPDGTTFNPSTAFVKTWRLKNIGTCTWTTAYSLMFLKDDHMGGPASIALPNNVAPGQTIDLSVNLTSPAAVKHYRGYWILRNASSTQFGYGPNANNAFWVDINVANPTVASIAYDFVANYCSATWASGAGTLPCPGTTSDANGFVVKLTSPQLENNTTGTDPALLTHPQNVNDGTISGTYPAFDVKSGDRFQSLVGCQYGSTVCFVRFRLDYQVGSDPVKTLDSWDEKIDNQYGTVNVDLSSLAGKSVKFILTILSLGSPTQDDALWSAARITRTTPVSTSGSCSLVSQSPANNTSFVHGADFDASWVIKNTSAFDWLKTNVDFVYVSGTKMHKFADIQDLPLDVVKNGNITLILDMLAPATNGTYSETWALVQGGSTICTMVVSIKVTQ
jgi:hypothetical protein